MNVRSILALLTAGGFAALAIGCARVEENRQDNTIHPDDSPIQGGISSQDIRTVASKMAPAILSVPEIAGNGAPVRVLIAEFKNSSRFLIDKSLFAKRLRIELNQYGQGKIRFIDRNANVQRDRFEAIRDRQEELIRQNLKQLGAEIAGLDLLKGSRPVKIAVIPVLNTNLVNMNADSFTAMLRSEIVQAGRGKVQFLMPGAVAGADYYLTGQFIPESMKKEGIINLSNYIEVIDARIRAGQSLNIEDGTVPASPGQPLFPVRQKESELVRMLRNPELRKNPNVNKQLNVMLVKPDTKVAVYEKMFMLDRKVSSRAGRAQFILSGEISALSQRRQGVVSDYLLVSVQLVDTESNEIVWEGAYETKKLSRSGVVYQ